MRIVPLNVTEERVLTVVFVMMPMTVAQRQIYVFVINAQWVMSHSIRLTRRDFALCVKKIGTQVKWILPTRVHTTVLPRVK